MRAQRLEHVQWRSSTLGGFEAMAHEIEDVFGPPSARDLDSNGVGPFDCHCLRFDCGLEIALWRFQWGPQGPKDAAVEPLWFEIHANQTNLEHIGFHVGIERSRMQAPVDIEGRALVEIAARRFHVLRKDDNANQFLVATVTSACEAVALVEEYERRGHKQTYWFDEQV